MAKRLRTRVSIVNILVINTSIFILRHDQCEIKRKALLEEIQLLENGKSSLWKKFVKFLDIYKKLVH